MTNEGQKRPFVTSYFGLVLVSIAILLILIFTPLGGLIHGMWLIRQSEKSLQNRNDYPAIANACSQLLLQLGTNESQTFDGTNATLPQAVRQLGARWITTSTNQVKIGFGGGHHHWGLYYMEVLDPTNSWRSLEFTSDGSKGKHLWP
jgi:uncharacterized protein YneF (UPF0154 family)